MKLLSVDAVADAIPQYYWRVRGACGLALRDFQRGSDKKKNAPLIF